VEEADAPLHTKTPCGTTYAMGCDVERHVAGAAAWGIRNSVNRPSRRSEAPSQKLIHGAQKRQHWAIVGAMSGPPSPLAAPDPWETIADGYVTDLVPMFEQYSRDALRLAELPPRAHVADIACGPGTASLLAARQAERVDALDFAPAMLEHLRRRAAAEGVSNVHAQAGDGQALPFDDDRFDAALSMFGLIFYPDRGLGMREMRRVLKPNGRAVISSWAPLDRVPVLAAVFTAMGKELPALMSGGVKLALADPAEFKAEMEAAGFREVIVHEITHKGRSESIEAYWQSNLRSSAPIALIRKRLGPAFETFYENVRARLAAEMGTGPIEWDWVAYLGVGQK
jgi:SAM-dependent methyltransferase